MITAIGQLESGDHKGSWAFVAEFDAATPRELLPEQIEKLDRACDTHAQVIVLVNGKRRPWLPTRELVE